MEQEHDIFVCMTLCPQTRSDVQMRINWFVISGFPIAFFTVSLVCSATRQLIVGLGEFLTDHPKSQTDHLSVQW